MNEAYVSDAVAEYAFRVLDYGRERARFTARINLGEVRAEELEREYDAYLARARAYRAHVGG